MMIHQPGIEELQGITLPLWEMKEFILERLDEGFYGTVYKATHCSSKEVFVLKVLKDDEEENRKMFIDEIHMLSKLHHPNVIQCKGVVFQDGHFSYLTEFIEGGTLQELMIDQDSLQLSWNTYLNITLDVARGMAYLHHQGIIHRDLNSKNILVRETNHKRYTAFIIDLGLSYQRSDESLHTEDLPHGPVGSPYHIAPELFNDESCSQKTDVFSFGIILCELISGCPGADPEELPRTLDFGLNVEEFSELASDCPPEYLNLAVRCCQVDSDLRPQFADVVKILDIVLDRLEESDSASDLKPDEILSELKTTPVRNNDKNDNDYIIEPSVLCTCGKLRKTLRKNSFSKNSPLEAIKHTEVYRTSSRRLMRKCVSRCSICGGRKLLLEEIKDNIDKISLHLDSDVTSVEQLSSKDQPLLDSECLIRSRDSKDCVIQTCHIDNITSISCMSVNNSSKNTMLLNNANNSINNLEPSISLYPAAALLKADRDCISTKTTQLAASTPGRLPAFFLRLLRRRRSNIAASNLFSEPRWRSLNRLFQLSKSSTSISQKFYKHNNNSSQSPEPPHSPQTPPKTLEDSQKWTVSLFLEKSTLDDCTFTDLCNSSGDEDILSKSLSPRFFAANKDKSMEPKHKGTRAQSLEVPLPVMQNVSMRSGSYSKKKRPRSLIDTFRKKKTS